MYLTSIKLLERFTKVLAAILSLEVLQVLLSSSYHFKSKAVAFGWTAKLVQNNFSRVMDSNLASCSTRYLRSGDHVR